MKGFEGPSLPAGRQGFRVLSLKKSLQYLARLLKTDQNPRLCYYSLQQPF